MINDIAPVTIAQQFEPAAIPGTFTLNGVVFLTTFESPAVPSTLVHWGGLVTMAFEPVITTGCGSIFEGRSVFGSVVR